MSGMEEDYMIHTETRKVNDCSSRKIKLMKPKNSIDVQKKNQSYAKCWGEFHKESQVFLKCLDDQRENQRRITLESIRNQYYNTIIIFITNNHVSNSIFLFLKMFLKEKHGVVAFDPLNIRKNGNYASIHSYHTQIDKGVQNV